MLASKEFTVPLLCDPYVDTLLILAQLFKSQCQVVHEQSQFKDLLIGTWQDSSVESTLDSWLNNHQIKPNGDMIFATVKLFDTNIAINDNSSNVKDSSVPRTFWNHIPINVVVVIIIIIIGGMLW